VLQSAYEYHSAWLCLHQHNSSACGANDRLNNASPERILELSRANLLALNDILRWNIEHNILLFRISSGTIPFGSHPVNQLAWWDQLAPQLNLIGKTIRAGNMRVSMHPGQYTVLNSNRAEVVENSAAELIYHARLLDALGTDASHKIILHGGGVYGNKNESLQRFATNAAHLPLSVRQRLVLENDETSYTLADMLSLSELTGLPVVFDVFHHELNPSFEGEPLEKLVARAAQTWKTADGRQKLHYSNQWVGKPPGAHAATIDLAAFSQFYERVRGYQVDLMLEVKDKEQSVLKIHAQYPELAQPINI
jgi:UV DNA damage endonuclease